MRVPAVLLLLVFGCEGVIDDPGNGGPVLLEPDPGGEPVPDLPDVDACLDAPLATGARPLSRLTRRQYRNTVRDLLQVDTEAAQAFVDDERVAGFEAARSISALQVEKYLEAAAELAAEVDPSALLPCDPADGESCALDFVDAFGRRAFRRPLTDEERTDLLMTWQVGSDGSSFEDGVRLVVEAVLASPDFLYHVEVGGAPGTVVPLDDFALASRLSYFLWGSMPDDALLDEAEAGTLDLELEAERMLADGRFDETVLDFYRQWLGLDRLEGGVKDPAVYPEHDADLARDLRASLEAFVHHVHTSDASLEALLTGDVFFANARLAEVYGGSADGEALERQSGRRGLLAQPGLLALLAKSDQSDPIHRGVFVREQLLCHHLPEPPNDVDLIVRPPEPGLSTRERFAEHTESDVCAGCHRLIDPLGFGFEEYDGIGRFRSDEDGVAIDASGEVLDGGDASGTFEGLDELSSKLAESSQVRRCYATQWFRFALRRDEHDDDACSLAGVVDRFGDGDLRELVLGVVTSDAFRHRRIPTEDSE